MVEVRKFDLRGLRCPMPIVELNRVMREVDAGEEVCVLADDVAFCPDIEAWCDRTANVLVSCNTGSEGTVAVIRKGKGG